ncbi:Aldehyde dehydrogenase [Actinomortierella ambigua]|uniref:Aldehyde dehydrogenase n=1 Tax=Actinomortierella ambigua TaxID=1343610 RepID=A0A9P6QIE8_9FUNG|nr:Aldehyde dehydrogenase [Actinomortierella ambigua]KAG0267836.1 Aldehyde dehydrogenase [Actinomortierella ambigua]
MTTIRTARATHKFPQIVGPFINNKFQASVAAKPVSRPLYNPCNEELLVELPEGGPEDVDLAVQAARKALEGPWKDFSGKKKRNVLLEIAATIEKNMEDLTALEAACGKPYLEAKFDIEDSIDCLRYFAGHADKLSGRAFATENGIKSYTLRKPVGVCGLITSFNYPLLLAIWKVAPALACGNTIVLKPAHQTPLSSLLLGDLIAKNTSLPEGVLNVVPGGAEVGQAIVAHPGVNKCSFTGSGAVGRKVMAGIAATGLKGLTLELGGKSPLIVFKDANMDRTVEDVFGAIFSNMGQNCCAGSRLYLEQGIEHEFLAKLKARIAQVEIGSSLDERYDYGAMVDRAHFERVMGFLNDAKARNAPELFVGGGRHGDKGYFIQPTVFVNVPEDDRLAREEIFGPVLCVMKPFTSIDEVIQRANATPYGLASGVFTSDLGKAEKMVQALDSGVTWVNTYNSCSVHLPFGGVKESGIGKDLGAEALDEYTTVKAVTMRID